ncbi:MAG: type III-B CRISPR module RAMP protein Cmr6 [Clostridia bacterium]|nr:type III-B CRISPR module RAMP protein Cmr6 [Clostridia bacterium]
MKNLSYLFHKEYFRCLTEEHFAKCNAILYSAKFTQKDYNEVTRSSLGNASFALKVLYPGLLLGHETIHGNLKSSEECIKAGLILDDVTGMPYIPAATIKGVVRNAFENPEMIRDLLGRNDVDALLLEKELLGELGDKTPRAERDIFFDAVMIRGSKTGKILAPEFRASEKSPLHNHVLQKFLKIRPKVTFLFRFDLKDGIITAEEKKMLLKSILMIMGIGARTSVGYGMFHPTHMAYYNPEPEHPIDTIRDLYWPKEEETERRQELEEKLLEIRMPQEKQIKVLCACGTTNMKYHHITKTVNSTWKRGTCFRCGADLKTQMEEAEKDEQNEE